MFGSPKYIASSAARWSASPVIATLRLLAIALVTLCAFAASAQAQVIQAIDFACDLPECDEASFREDLISVTGLQVGIDATEERVELARANLMATQYFASVDTVTVPSGGGIELQFVATGLTLIRRVRVRAGRAITDDVERRIFLRSGEAWTNDPVEISRQEHAIREYYERDGFFGTEVTIEAEPVDDFVVDLRVQIERGSRLRVDNIYVRGNEALTYDEVRTALLSEFRVLRGYTSEDFQRGGEAVLRAYRDIGYIEARLSTRYADPNVDTDTVRLFLEIDEGDQWEIAVVGNRRFTRERLLDSMTFYQTGFVDT